LLSITHETALNLDTSKQLLALSRKEPNARKRMRLLAVSLFFEGENRAKIARRLNTARGSVNKWVSSYLDNGLEGLDNKPYSGRPAKLTEKQQHQVKEFVLKHTLSDNGGRLIAADIQEYISSQFNVNYQLGNVYRLLHSLNLSWITSRSKHPKQSVEAQEAFKKVSSVNDPTHPI